MEYDKRVTESKLITGKIFRFLLCELQVQGYIVAFNLIKI